MPLSRTLVLGLALALSCVACDDEEEDVTPRGDAAPGADAGADAASADAEPPAPLTIVTYNVGLARGFVPHAEARVTPAVEAIGRLEADVICLQEVWEPDDVAAVVAATEGSHPHRFVPVADPGVCGACAPEDADPLEACVRAECADHLDDPVACALDRCDAEVDALAESCFVCLGANIGGSLDDLLAACGGETAACYAYGGSYGTMLLSRFPLEGPSLTTWSSSLNRRGVLHARVPGTPAGDVHVYCTHLTAIFDDIPYPGAGPGDDSVALWTAEQRAQIDALRAQVDTEAGTGPAVLLGDFNTGPDVAATGVTAEAAANYVALSAGFEVPFVDDPGTCTFCSAENPLIDGTGARLIDHVLLRGFGARAFAAARILDQAVQVASGEARVESRLSDHYGVQVEIR